MPEAADTAGQVWVNTKSGKYSKPGSHYYGKTKQGHILSKKRGDPERIPAGEWYGRMIVMGLNSKLTHLIKGRTIQSEFGDEGHVAITFDDASTLKLRVAGQATNKAWARRS